MQFFGAVVEVVLLSIIVEVVVVEIARRMPDEFIEAAFCRPRSLGKPDVPLAETPRRVRSQSLPENLRNQNLVMAEPNSIVPDDTAKLVSQTMSLRNSPGQQARSGDSAGWRRRIEPGQSRTLFRESIK